MKRLTFILLSLISFNFIFAAGGTIPAGLPNYFAFGAIDKQDTYSPDQPSRWKTGQNASCKVWDYNYQYFVPGWTTWASPAGQWGLNELKYWEVEGQMMVATFYYSYGNKAYFQSTTNMNSYWSDLKVLFQLINSNATKPVIIHFEPDGIGFWKQANISATSTGSVMVGSCSGVDSALSGLPDSLQGWNAGIIALRNKYAPNKALIAHHFTHWATGTDLFVVDGNSDTQSEVDSEVKEMTDYIKTIENGKPADLFFVDPSDRDAAWYDAFGSGGRWTDDVWDTSAWNKRTWGRIGYIVDKVSTNLDRKGMFWQIPTGNDYYTTCNNTDGHYKDDHAQEAFLRSGTGGPGSGYSPTDTTKGPGFWASKGIIACLFGSGYYGEKPPGGNNLTHLRDYKKDGATGSGTYSDDDGGYIRLGAAAYCAAGKFPLSGSVSTPTYTYTNTATNTATRTNTPIPPTSTYTYTNTATNTATRTYTATNTNTAIPPTNTYTGTNTATNTATRTFTAIPPTSTHTFTRTATNTYTSTNTAVPPTFTHTHTNTFTNTNTHTATLTPTSTNTVPVGSTNTNTYTVTNTFTNTHTYTATNTNTAVPPTSTNTTIPSSTNTTIPGSTNTHTFTITNTYTATHTPTNTAIAALDVNINYMIPSGTVTLGSTSVIQFNYAIANQQANTVVIMLMQGGLPVKTLVYDIIAKAPGNYNAEINVTNLFSTVSSGSYTIRLSVSNTIPQSDFAETAAFNFVNSPTSTATVPSASTATNTNTFTHTPTATFTHTYTPTEIVTPAPTESMDPKIEDLLVYPNPYSGGKLKIRCTLTKKTQGISFRLYSASFRLLKEHKNTGAQMNGEVIVEVPEKDLKPLSNGTYYYVLTAETDAGSKIRSKADKFIIMK